MTGESSKYQSNWSFSLQPTHKKSTPLVWKPFALIPSLIMIQISDLLLTFYSYPFDSNSIKILITKMWQANAEIDTFYFESVQ